MRPSIMSLGATMSTPACGLHQRLLDQHFDGLVVQDVAGVVEQAVLAVAGERVERHVGHHAQLREFLLQRRTTRGTSLRDSRLRGRRASSARIDDREQRQHRDAQGHALLRHRQQQVEAERSTPGMEATAWRLRSPSSTNTG
jgi:hypothetical protein